MTDMTNPRGAEVAEALRDFDSPTVSNAIERFKVRDPVTGYASMELRCQFPDLNPMVGYAVTCRADTTSPGDSRLMRLDDLLDAVRDAPKPAIVVIEHVGKDRSRSCFVGDMFCTALQKLGVVGVVTDGGARDGSGIRRRAPGFHLFSPGWVVSHGHGVFLDFGLPASICGLTIEAGDLLHGDASGLLTVPLEIVHSVRDAAESVLRDEGGFFDWANGDGFACEELKRRIGRR